MVEDVFEPAASGAIIDRLRPYPGRVEVDARREPVENSGHNRGISVEFGLY